MSKALKFSIMKYDWADSNGNSEEMYEVAAVGTSQMIDDLDWDALKLLRDFLIGYIAKKEREVQNEK